MAREPGGAQRAALRERVDKAWNAKQAARQKRKRVKATKTEREVSTDSAVVDLVEWLALHPTTADQVEAIAELLGKEVVDELDKSVDAAHRERRRRALADHFWCDLLAAFAAMLDDVSQQLDAIPDRVTSAIITARGQGKRSAVGDLTVKLAVHQAWSRIRELPFVAAALPDVEGPLRAVRILAVTICPAPESHREVTKHCLHPLAGECVSEVTKQRLRQALPDDWLY